MAETCWDLPGKLLIGFWKDTVANAPRRLCLETWPPELLSHWSRKLFPFYLSPPPWTMLGAWEAPWVLLYNFMWPLLGSGEEGRVSIIEPWQWWCFPFTSFSCPTSTSVFGSKQVRLLEGQAASVQCELVQDPSYIQMGEVHILLLTYLTPLLTTVAVDSCTSELSGAPSLGAKWCLV